MSKDDDVLNGSAPELTPDAPMENGDVFDADSDRYFGQLVFPVSHFPITLQVYVDGYWYYYTVQSKAAAEEQSKVVN